MYNVWKQITGVKHGNLLKTLKQTTWETRSRIMSRGKFTLTSDDVELCNRWNLPENPLKGLWGGGLVALRNLFIL